MSAHQEVAADAGSATQIVHAVEKLGQVSVQALVARIDLVDAAILQVGQQPPGARCGPGTLRKACRPVAVDCSLATTSRRLLTTSLQAGVQRARHVGAQDQQVGHALGLDHVAVDLAVDLEAETLRRMALQW
jgi:hypothetical protein